MKYHLDLTFELTSLFAKLIIERVKQDLDDDEIELNEEETVGSQIEIHRKNTIRLNTMDTIQEQIGEPSCQRIADVGENDIIQINYLLDNAPNYLVGCVIQKRNEVKNIFCFRCLLLMWKILLIILSTLMEIHVKKENLFSPL